MDDTTPEAHAFLTEGYRRMRGSEKLAQVFALNCSLEELALSGLRRLHPDASERELRLRLASRWLDAELMRSAFGWDPSREGY